MAPHFKTKLLITFFGLIIGTTMIASDQPPINESNWLNHLQIKEIRVIYQEIEAGIQSKKLKEYRKTFEYEIPYEPTLKVIYVDQNSVAKKYIEEAGSDDSALTFSYYYDSNQILRFTFIHGGAVNGSELEHRIYFDSSGKRIWEVQKYLKGPGYTFPSVWPQNRLVLDPWKEFKKK